MAKLFRTMRYDGEVSTVTLVSNNADTGLDALADIVSSRRDRYDPLTFMGLTVPLRGGLWWKVREGPNLRTGDSEVPTRKARGGYYAASAQRANPSRTCDARTLRGGGTGR